MIKAEVNKSLEVNKTNTLHQFDASGIIGLESPVGKIPIVFYMKETCKTGRRGIIYYDDYDTLCFMFPEDEHSEWCKQPYAMKYDKAVHFDNGVESGYRRNYGIFELWVEVLRKWYNGRVLFRPTKKIKGCGGCEEGYPVESEEVETVEPKKVNIVKHSKTSESKSINRSCGCRRR